MGAVCRRFGAAPDAGRIQPLVAVLLRRSTLHGRARLRHVVQDGQVVGAGAGAQHRMRHLRLRLKLHHAHRWLGDGFARAGKTGGDDRHAQVVAEALVVGGAEDHMRVIGRDQSEARS